MPPFDVSALDGFGVKGPGARFEVKASLSTPSPIPARLKEGRHSLLPTGGRLPGGSRFVMREHATERKSPEVRVRVGRKTGGKERGLAPPGEARRRQEATLHARGYGPRRPRRRPDACKYTPRPSVAVITTGSELKSGQNGRFQCLSARGPDSEGRRRSPWPLHGGRRGRRDL